MGMIKLLTYKCGGSWCCYTYRPTLSWHSMNNFAVLFVAVVCFQVARPGATDVPEDRQGVDALSASDSAEMEASIEEKVRELRIEMVKFQILSKLNLKDAPPSVEPPSGTSREVIRLLIKEDEERKKIQHRLFDSEERLVFHSKGNGMSCLQSNESFCKRFQFELSATLNTSSMDIWIFKLTEFPRWASILLSFYSSDDQKSYEILYYQLDNVGWNKLELPRLLLSSSWNDTVHYSVEIIGQNIEEHGDLRPFLMVTKLSLISSRQRRDSDCDTSENCCLKPLRVSFNEMGFNWVIYPQELEVNACIGKCRMDHSALRTHYERAMTTVLENNRTLHGYLGECWTLCCKPKILEAVRVLYNDTEGIIHDQYIPELSVKSCTCS